MAGKLQRQRQTLIKRIFVPKFCHEKVFKVEQKGLAFAEDINVNSRHRAMLNLIPQLYKEFKVHPHSRMFGSPEFRQTRRQLPGLLVAVEHLEVSAIASLAIEWFLIPFEENGMKQSRPSYAHQDDVPARSKARPWPVVRLNS
jgi:hypothetical protein